MYTALAHYYLGIAELYNITVNTVSKKQQQHIVQNSKYFTTHSTKYNITGNLMSI